MLTLTRWTAGLLGCVLVALGLAAVRSRLDMPDPLAAPEFVDTQATWMALAKEDG